MTYPPFSVMLIAAVIFAVLIVQIAAAAMSRSTFVRINCLLDEIRDDPAYGERDLRIAAEIASEPFEIWNTMKLFVFAALLPFVATSVWSIKRDDPGEEREAFEHFFSDRLGFDVTKAKIWGSPRLQELSDASFEATFWIRPVPVILAGIFAIPFTVLAAAIAGVSRIFSHGEAPSPFLMPSEFVWRQWKALRH